MALNLAQKKTIVDEVADLAANAASVVLVDYCGLTVSDMTNLRVQARAAGVTLRVVRNTLTRRALAQTPYAALTDKVYGPLMLAFSSDEPSACARVLKDFMKDNEKIAVKALAIGNELYGPEHLGAVASLPTKDEAIARLMSVMIGPVTKLVRTLAAPQVKLVRTLAAIVEDKKASE